MLIKADRWTPRLLGLATGLMVSGLELDVGLKLRPFDLVVVTAALISLLAIRDNGLRAKRITSILLLMGAYGGYLLGNALLLSRPADALKETIQFAFFVVFFLVFVQSIRSDATTQRFARWAFASLLAIGLWNAGWHIAHGAWSGWKGLDEPKLAHSLFVVLIAAVMAGSNPAARAVWRPVLILALVLMLLSGERKGWLAAGCALAAMAIFLPAGRGLNLRRIVLYATLVTGLAGLVIGIAPHFPYVSKQVESSQDFARLLVSGTDPAEIDSGETTISNRARLFGVTVAIGFFNERPIFGIGLENYDRRVDAMDIPDEFRKGAHNEVLRIAAELGAVGLFLYAALHLAILGRIGLLLRRRRRSDPLALFRLRLGIGLLTYGIVANLFLGGGGVNLFLVFLPAALSYSVPIALRTPLRTRRPGATLLRSNA